MEKLENKLTKDNWIKSDQFIKAKEIQQKTKKSLYSALIKLGYLSERDVYLFFSQNARIPYVNISDYILGKKILELFNEDLYRERLFLPLAKMDGTLYTCMANPLDTDLVNTLELQTNLEIYPLFCDPSSLQAAINKYFGPNDSYFDMEGLIISPQTLGMIPFWRESERLSVNMAVELKPEDESIRLVSSSYFDAVACDISRSGRAIGMKTFIFLPPGIDLSVKFPLKDKPFTVKGEVIRCDIEKDGRYFLGVRFTQVSENLLKRIIEPRLNC